MENWTKYFQTYVCHSYEHTLHKSFETLPDTGKGYMMAQEILDEYSLSITKSFLVTNTQPCVLSLITNM